MKKDQGFTLIEIIVSLGIFTVVAVVAVGAYLKVLDANKKSQTLKTAINNINFALESMTREMRVGSSYYCYANAADFPIGGVTASSLPSAGHGCASGNGGIIAFASSKGGLDNPDSGATCRLAYAYAITDYDPANLTATSTITKAEQKYCNQAITTSDFIPVISPDAIIDAHVLKVIQGVASGPQAAQPKVFIRLKGHTGVKEKSKTYFDVQTTISQRNQF
ncbi:MAG: seg [Candidatus Taylorbacteria bacterium]|nr:seg [Candidatus Taylorbacteria bacterium]